MAHEQLPGELQSLVSVAGKRTLLFVYRSAVASEKADLATRKLDFLTTVKDAEHDLLKRESTPQPISEFTAHIIRIRLILAALMGAPAVGLGVAAKRVPGENPALLGMSISLTCVALESASSAIMHLVHSKTDSPVDSATREVAHALKAASRAALRAEQRLYPHGQDLLPLPRLQSLVKVHQPAVESYLSQSAGLSL